MENKFNETGKLNKVFLGGTCNETAWREELIPMLQIDYFNPVVKDWNEEAQKEEEHQKNICGWQLYVITPAMTGVFSIAEAVDSSNKNPTGTVFCILDTEQFESFQQKSLKAVKELVKNNGAFVVDSLKEVADILNKTILVNNKYEYTTITGTKEEVTEQLHGLDNSWIYESDNFDNDIFNITVKRKIID